MKVVIVNCFDTYEHRVDLLHNFFSSRGNQVKVYTSDFCHFEKVERTDKKEDFIYIKTKPYYKNISIARLRSHHKLSKDIFRKIGKEPIDLLWVLIPPNSFTKDATLYKRAHPHTKLIFDIMDMWPETMPVEKIEKLPLIQMWRGLRDKYLDAADEIVTECDLYHEKIPASIERKKIHTIYLAREIKTFFGKPNPPKDQYALCYLGSINNIIDISAIGKIIKELRKEKPVELHIIGDGEKRDELIETAQMSSAKVIYHGKIYDAAEKQRIFDSCHYGLNIMKDTVCVGLTMKSMDYFEAGMPIINNIHGDTWDMVEKYGIGVNYESEKRILIQKNNGRERIRLFYESKFGTGEFNRRVAYIVGNRSEED